MRISSVYIKQRFAPFLTKLCVAFMLLSAIVSCGNGGVSPQNIVGDSVVMRYSSLLGIVECDGYTVVDIKKRARQ